MIQEQVLTKWGYRGEEHPCQSTLRIFYRPGTTDEKVIEEVLIKNAYQKKKIGFLVEPNDFWLDLGGNIGTFALHVLSNCGKVVTVEPESENLQLLTQNLQTNSKSSLYYILPACVSTYNGYTDLYLCNGDYNKYRHSMHLQSKRKSVKVPVVDIHDLLDRYPGIDCLKIDIEGEEINLLENIELEYLKTMRKLVFEYSFDVDPSIPRFLAIIDRLKSAFSTVHFTGVKTTDLEYKHYPPCVNVYCLK